MNNPFLVGRSVVTFTNDGKLFIVEFTLTLPLTNDNNTRQPTTFHQHIIMNPEQTKDFCKVLKNMVKDYEKKFGEIKGNFKVLKLDNKKNKEENSYIG